MSRIESYAPGSFCWAELATGDPAAAKQFYAEMFGWAAVDMPTPNGPYTLLKAEGDDVAALYSPAPGVPVHWGVYFAVAGADEAAERIASLGGKVVAGPFDAMDAGRMAVGEDPQGAIFSVWEARKHIGATYGGSLSRVLWPELMSPDTAGSAAFYSQMFGWGTRPETGVESAPYTEWLQGGQSMGGLLPMKGDNWAGVPPHWGIYITVADCNERSAKAVELGGKVCVQPTDIPNVGRFSVIGDPQGAVFSIIQMTAIHQPATA
jgi:predicted enzyme related to lactoylglutathione lyase